MKPQKSFSNNEHVQHEILFLGSNPKLSFCVCKWSIPYFVGKKKTALLTKSKTFLEVFGVSLDSQANKSQLNARLQKAEINQSGTRKKAVKSNRKPIRSKRFFGGLTAIFIFSFLSSKKNYFTREHHQLQSNIFRRANWSCLTGSELPVTVSFLCLL